MTDSGATGGLPAGGGSDDEAIWRDLVARFDTPVVDAASVPWPEREDLAERREDLAERRESPRPARADTLPGADPAPGVPADTVTFSPVPPAPAPRGAPPASAASAPVEDDHFVPPPPPPLPKLDPVTKGAWAALFGGPAYLLLATAIGWSVPGIAAFIAVAAFVGGFAVLVLRMDDGPPRDSGPDDGAIV